MGIVIGILAVMVLYRALIVETGPLTTTAGLWHRLWGSVSWWAEVAVHNPIGTGIFAVVAVVLIASGSMTGRDRRDPQRGFTTAQRREGFARAGNRCEYESLPFIRCKANATDGDHFYPWSRGGATNLDNFVASCSKHNQAKKAKMPSAWCGFKIEMRRRRYFPPEHKRRPGAWM